VPRPQIYSDCVVSGFGSKVELLGEVRDDWRVTMVDTGVWRNIGERLWAVRDHVEDEDMFLANYSDGLTDLDLGEMIAKFKATGKIAAFLAVRPSLSYHFAEIEADGRVSDIRSVDHSDMWINGGYFIFRREIFDYMREGEELVVEPFQRLIKDDQLVAYKHPGFWRSMDTLKDRQVLEDMVEQGNMPWRVDLSKSAARKNVVVAAE
jgi:glucose-1-phosphate cytidylyltransferase